MSDELDDSIELFYGEANPAVARVYARWIGASDAGEIRLSGTLSGPTCRYARTLPSRAMFAESRLLHAGVGVASPSLPAPLPPGERGGSLAPRGIDKGVDVLSTHHAGLVEAVVPDPCFWSPLEPYLYDARLDVTRDGESLGVVRRTIGLRRFGVSGRRLMLDGKNWAARIISRSNATDEELSLCREIGAALLVDRPDDMLCDAASRIGVFLVARVSGDEAEIRRELRRLARFAAVAVAIVESDAPLPDDLPHACPNVLLAYPTRGDAGDSEQVPGWAQLVVVEDTEVNRLAERTTACARPVIVVRPSATTGTVATIESLRAECDVLQRDLAGKCEPVGYGV